MKSTLGWVSVGLIVVCNVGGPAWASDNLDQQLDIQPHNATAGPARDVADQWMQLGHQQMTNEQYSQAIESWQQAADIYQTLGDTQSEGNAYNAIALAYAHNGQLNEAERFFRLRIAVAQDNHDRTGEIYGLNNVGSVQINQGNLIGARASFEEALTLARAIQDDKGIGVSLSNLGLLATLQGDLASAATLYETAANYRVRAGDYLGEGYSSSSLGDVYVDLGRQSEAIGAYRIALRDGIEAGDTTLQLRALDGLLKIYLDRADLNNVQTYLDQRIDLTLHTHPPDLETAKTLQWMGDYYRQIEDLDAAAAAYNQGLSLSRSLGNKPLEAEFYNRLLAL